jgi:ATP-dependent Lhr-like helicase
MHRGEKRLVFVDSRARAEELAAELRKLDVTVFVTHSSLGREQRAQTEQAFTLETNCVIVATSALELGVDVGDLDRIIHIDAPATVASFLQRMGRTGRRLGTDSNCLFLATNDYALLQAAGIIDLWMSGYVEDVVAPPVPYHVLAQQLFALVLQEQDCTREDWGHWVGTVARCAGIKQGCVDAMIAFALDTGLLCEDSGILHMGPVADRRLGRRNFIELLSVISSRPLFQVRHGRYELGFVHPLSFTADRQGPTILALGGRSWRVINLDWKRKVAHVEPSGEKGRSRWTGSSAPLLSPLCVAIRNVLGSAREDPCWSRRACSRIRELRQELSPVVSEGTAILQREGGCEWWTFAGLRVNQTIASMLEPVVSDSVRADNLWIKFSTRDRPHDLWKAILSLRDADTPFIPCVSERIGDLLKFGDLLPPELLREVSVARMMDLPGAYDVLGATTRIIEA